MAFAGPVEKEVNRCEEREREKTNKMQQSGVDNKHLIVASCLFPLSLSLSLSLHNFLTMHGHRNLKLNRCVNDEVMSLTIHG